MKSELLRPIVTIKCHCGNVTETLGNPRLPSDKSRKLCCLQCRCDECPKDKTYRPTDLMPGCGPRCIYHSVAVMEQRLREAEDRAFRMNREKA